MFRFVLCYFVLFFLQIASSSCYFHELSSSRYFHELSSSCFFDEVFMERLLIITVMVNMESILGNEDDNKKEPLLNHVMEKGVLSMSIKMEMSTQVVCKTAQLVLPIFSQATNDANGAANFLKESFQFATQSANQVSFNLARKVVSDCKKWLTISLCFVVIVRSYY